MQHKLVHRSILEFQRFLLNWYQKQGRNLPWRKTTNPYHILVAEIMLQQTQVDRVILKYGAFLQKFPALQDLAVAPTAEVLKLWTGLGYNSRALRLQKAAQVLSGKRSFPKKAEELLELPGIGPYTCRSILIFAFNQNEVTVDTNIRRVFIHELGLKEDASEKELWEFAEKCLPQGKSRDWHNALMDYGATLLTARRTGVKSLGKQSTFAGSRRWYRGDLVKKLVNGENLTFGTLERVWKKEKNWVVELVQGMEKEGLVTLEKGKVRLG